ncbi:ABC-type transport auxiliary lipoprotein family protein [Legionella oakridgensis]|uniref:ABC-typetransport system, auxiliary component n=2 Tax=Legionella oakridgensis TaxID=29423 RepID=W0BCA6_9GAMM|nr:hypothetical protein [Legionella oakridgensis]AHE68173.1 ABC-typetransport system, auxiliary component [Legionella oakridgensis ATCC 33761 = DSM 21215]ETO92262.1 ABC-type transport system, auxiliary component [Legionella oakridgensis RV-2-2007]KTD39626.1 transport protein [Legionella oakridgensis]STY21138.1 ABC transporter auxiliary component [Legionella longbeachae]
MNKGSVLRCVLFICLLSLGSGCAVKTSVNNQYKLENFGCTPVKGKRSASSILVTQPEAVAGYQTEQMLYMVKPFELNPFAHSAWVGAPANMLFPLILQSLQYSNYFSAVISTPYGEKADYRLDTQLIELHQNFLANPSRIELIVKVVLTYVADNHVIASKIIKRDVQCPENTPYGGVLAANIAVKEFTEIMTEFVIAHIKQQSPYSKTMAKNYKQLYNVPPSTRIKKI